MKKIKIGYFADGPWAHRAFEKLIKDNAIEIAFICIRFDKNDEILKEYAKKYGLDLLLTPNINSREFIESLKKYNSDLFVSMSFNQIFKNELINLPRYKTINCHAGKLPFYRGRNILNWALINDEKEFGITVHYVDEGIDTGDIILQRTYPITDEDSYKTLLERAYIGCADILYDAIKEIQNEKVQRIPQKRIDKIGFYCGSRQQGDEIIDWNQTSRELFNFVRAICKPGPMATTYKNGVELKINKVKLLDCAKSYKGIPGQVLGKSPEGFYVKTKDTFIDVIECVCIEKIKTGDRLVAQNNKQDMYIYGGGGIL